VRLRWLASSEIVELKFGDVLYEPASSMTHVYFPTQSIVSLQYETENGSTTEMAVVGMEGLVGISLFMGGESTPSRAIVRSEGSAIRIDARLIKADFHQSRAVMHLLLRYTQALMTQMSQMAVCNRLHTLDKQLCRCLLLSNDRLPGNELALTQGLIAEIMGVRREGVTAAAMKLQAEGLIQYARGRIHIKDRLGLEQRSCECYEVLRREYARLLPNNTAT
jgi:CRP-like cAMP-binding protein